MALTVVLVLPPDATDSQQITAFSTLLQIASGHALSQVGDMVAVALLVLSMNAWVLGTSRVVYSQARTGCCRAGWHGYRDAVTRRGQRCSRC